MQLALQAALQASLTEKHYTSDYSAQVFTLLGHLYRCHGSYILSP